MVVFVSVVGFATAIDANQRMASIAGECQCLIQLDPTDWSFIYCKTDRHTERLSFLRTNRHRTRFMVALVVQSNRFLSSVYAAAL